MSLSKAAYGTSRLLRALIPIYKIKMQRKEAKRPIKIPDKQSEWKRVINTGKMHTGSEVLVLIEQRLAAVRLFRIPRMSRVVALQFHMDRVWERVLVRVVDDGVGLGELSRRGDVEDGILRGGNSVNDIGKEAI